MFDPLYFSAQDGTIVPSSTNEILHDHDSHFDQCNSNIVKMRNVARATRRDSLPTVPSSPRPITFLAFDLPELKYVVAFALP